MRFNLRNITKHNRTGDDDSFYTGELFFGDEFIISFYEQSIEGGYYPNGNPKNEAKYNEFICGKYSKMKLKNELEIFDSKIEKMMNKFLNLESLLSTLSRECCPSERGLSDMLRSSVKDEEGSMTCRHLLGKFDINKCKECYFKAIEKIIYEN